MDLHHASNTVTWQQLIENADFRQWVKKPTRETDAFIKEFIATDQQAAMAVEQARAFLLGVQEYYQLPELSLEAMRTDRERIATRVAIRRNRRRTFYRATAAAVTLLLVLTVSFLMWPDGNHSSNDNLIVLITGNGEQRTTILPDGTIVHLNANSTFSYPAEWDGQSDRTVALEGEAFFSVSRQPTTGAKFSVHTDDLVVEVLGTSFNVNSYFSATEVVLNEGRIKVLRPEAMAAPLAELSPGERLAYDRITQSLIHEKADTLAFTGWKDGKYVFDDTPLGEIVDKLSVVYGVEFELASPELRDVLVSTVASAENLDEFVRVLDLLFASDGIRVLRQEDGVLIRREEPPTD